MYNNAKTVPGENLFEYYELVFQLPRGLWNCRNSINYKDLLGRSFCKNESNKVYPASTQCPEDVRLWSNFGRDVPDHNRTKIGRFRFLIYFGSSVYGMHLAS